MKPILHIIVSNKDTQASPESYKLLLEAAAKQGQEVVTHQSDKVDFADLPKLNPGDFLYRKSTDHTSSRLEALLLNDSLVTFYSGAPTLIQRAKSPWSNAITLHKNGISIIPTIFHLELSNQEKLASAVKHLGGFPVIVKASGNAHGNGVFRFDSMESLWSARPLLVEYASEEKTVLRKYIPHTFHARLIVLGGKVIDSIEYIAPKNDFRTNNLDSPEVNPRKFSPEIEKLAILAVKALNLEFGGVDILVDEKSNQCYVAEVNFPCNFSRCQLLTGVDTAGLMISFLQEKSRMMGSL